MLRKARDLGRKGLKNTQKASKKSEKRGVWWSFGAKTTTPGLGFPASIHLFHLLEQGFQSRQVGGTGSRMANDQQEPQKSSFQGLFTCHFYPFPTHFEAYCLPCDYCRRQPTLFSKVVYIYMAILKAFASCSRWKMGPRSL